MNVLIWIVKTVFIYGIFAFAMPIVVNALTRDRWIKLPAMLCCSLVAGATMAWMNYKPWVLFWIWLLSTYSVLEEMKKDEFQHELAENGMGRNLSVFYVSLYTYVIVSCVLALALQSTVSIGIPGEPGYEEVPIWEVARLFRSRTS